MVQENNDDEDYDRSGKKLNENKTNILSHGR